MSLRKGQYIRIERGPHSEQLAVVTAAEVEGARVGIRSWSQASQVWSVERSILRRFVLGPADKDHPQFKAAREALLEETR